MHATREAVNVIAKTTIMIIERKTKRSKYELRISNRYLVETEAEAKIGDNRRVIR